MLINNHKTVQVNIFLNNKLPNIFPGSVLTTQNTLLLKEKTKDRNREGEDCKIVNVYRQRRGKKEKEKQEDLM